MSTAQIKNKSASIRDKLYNLSKNTGIDFNNLIILYILSLKNDFEGAVLVEALKV
ncbi:MAG TPA: hypothetical protein PLY12_01460 [Bacillota bacterium]|nr:hypothetical protein [Bacillota bacterium]HQQ44458.1 hypothetical protein [Bacillota bacterium]